MVELWDAELNAAIAKFGDGATLDLDLLASGDATIAVTAVAGGDLEGEIGSIRLSVDDFHDMVDNTEPYTLFGDEAGATAGGLVIEEGLHTLQLEVFIPDRSLVSAGGPALIARARTRLAGLCSQLVGNGSPAVEFLTIGACRI